MLEAIRRAREGGELDVCPKCKEPVSDRLVCRCSFVPHDPAYARQAGRTRGFAFTVDQLRQKAATLRLVLEANTSPPLSAPERATIRRQLGELARAIALLEAAR